MIGLNVKEHHKVFWGFKFYYHFDEFVKLMVNQNLNLEG